MNTETLKIALSAGPETLAENLERFYLDSVIPADVEAGKIWYRSAHAIAEGIAHEYGFRTDVVCALIAILSPSNSWGSNLEDTTRVIAGWTAGIAPDSLACCTYGPNVVKAYALLDAFRDHVPTSVESIGKGNKTRAFFLNLSNPETSGPVTIDRHAIGAATGCTDPGTLASVSVTDLRYRNVANAYASTAERFGFMPHVFQAIVWVAWRRLNVAPHILARDA